MLQDVQRIVRRRSRLPRRSQFSKSRNAHDRFNDSALAAASYFAQGVLAAYDAAQRKEALDATARFLVRLRHFDVQYLTDNILNQLGKRDHFTLRAATVEQLGDALRAARTGPVGLYRELAIAGYQAALSGGSQNPDLHLKMAAAYLERQQGTAEDNAKQSEFHLNTFLGLLDGRQYERWGIAYFARTRPRS